MVSLQIQIEQLSSIKKINECNNHIFYYVKYKEIKDYIGIYNNNRDIDELRVNMIYEYYKSGGYVPFILHLAQPERENIFKCYDGNHRWMVLNKIINEEYETDIGCIINVVYEVLKEDIYEKYVNINESVPVPKIYLEYKEYVDNKINNKRYMINEHIMKLVKEIANKYPNFVSGTTRCIAPNFNRDDLIDQITDIYNSFEDEKGNNIVLISEIREMLYELNERYCREEMCKKHIKYRENLRIKCNKYKFWLFMEKNINVDHIHKIYKEREGIKRKEEIETMILEDI